MARHVSRGRPLPELTVRKLRRERALERVAEFVHTHRALGHRYVRVITGKGLSSYAAPVLKPELITWCEHRGRGAVVLWAPERDDDGSFGAVVLRLRSSRRAGG
ncbi:MAG: Smr/MutS family protein [Myxococcales bacterium]|nr:Smr/MutS family protein [Myxococcales bacterium]